MTQDQAGKGVESSRSRAQSEDILKLREMRNQLSWAEARARRHLVRLGKWRRERGNPTSSDLSGAGTLLKIGNSKGILTVAHNIRCKFSRSDYKRHTMEAIIAKHGGPSVIWTDVDMRYAVVEGGYHSTGEPKDMGPDIAWIPLDSEKASFFERYGKVFFDWRDDRFPPVAREDSRTVNSLPIAVGHLVTGFSGEREKAVSSMTTRPYLVEVVQDVFFPDREWVIDGWDYEERVLDNDDDGDDVDVQFDKDVSTAARAVIPSRVNHVGGISGGAVWRFGCAEESQYFDLAGVVWYQRWRDESGVLRIVNHGRNSIRQIIGA